MGDLSMLAREKKQKDRIERRGYSPPEGHQLDVEIVSMSDLRQRVGKGHLQRVHRIEFHMLICVTRGECTHLVDFTPVHCRPSSLLALHPSQAEQFDADQDWDGWLVLFRPEFLLPSHTKAPVSNLSATRGLEHLPKHSSLQDHQLRFVLDAVHQMREDSRIEAPSAEVHALLRHDLHALLLRLSIMQGRVAAQRNATSLGLQLFRSFQKLVEKNFAQLHQVADYADLLGCSGKSLTRAAMEVAGVKAKEVIASRINLEAKRLLAYTTLPIALIGDSLGFDEATNFVKFFKREAGCTPGEFRRRQGEPRTL